MSKFRQSSNALRARDSALKSLYAARSAVNDAYHAVDRYVNVAYEEVEDLGMDPDNLTRREEMSPEGGRYEESLRWSKILRADFPKKFGRAKW